MIFPLLPLNYRIVLVDTGSDNMKFQPDQPNVESYCGIVDVYDDDVTSFSMKDPYAVHVKHRIDGDIAIVFDIEVV